MRLDAYLTEKGYFSSRTAAKSAIESGAVEVNGVVRTKPAFPVDADLPISVSQDGVCPFVSRGGVKLLGALHSFGVSPVGLVCLDVGASTGGFTDCLIQYGARKVYAVDSGRSQLHATLRCDSRVISIEECNARYLSSSEIPEPIDLCVMDVSFISQTKLYPALSSLIPPGGRMISLIKPQFEVGRPGVGKGGIVRDENLRKSACDAVIANAELFGFIKEQLIVSPIRGGDGNTEYLALFVKR